MASVPVQHRLRKEHNNSVRKGCRYTCTRRVKQCHTGPWEPSAVVGAACDVVPHLTRERTAHKPLRFTPVLPYILGYVPYASLLRRYYAHEQRQPLHLP